MLLETTPSSLLRKALPHHPPQATETDDHKGKIQVVLKMLPAQAFMSFCGLKKGCPEFRDSPLLYPTPSYPAPASPLTPTIQITPRADPRAPLPTNTFKYGKQGTYQEIWAKGF